MAESNANPFAGFDIAKRLRECIEPYLAGTTSGMPERSCVHVGAISWDDCECGQLIVALQDAGEIASFPDDQTPRPRRNCGPAMFTWNIDISILRCAPDGEPPSCEAIEAAARVSVEDAWAVRAGVICCMNAAIKEKLPNGTTYLQDYLTQRQTFVGPMGLCQGSVLPITVAMKNGCYPCIVS